jgi:type IV pilus assembly protein PilC
MRYFYHSLDNNGVSMDGFMEATSPEEVGVWLSDRGYFVIEIKPAPLQTLVKGSKNKVKLSRSDLNFFLIQLSSLINAGCPLLSSIDALAKQSPRESLRILLRDVSEKIKSGKSFSEALKYHNDIFSNLFITMIEVGEVGGILDEVLERYAYIHNATYRLRGKIIKSLIYPAFLLLITILATLFMVVVIFPNLIGQIQTAGQPLPLPTEIVLNISNFISTYYAHFTISIAILIACYIKIRKTVLGKRITDKIYVKTIILGNIIKQIQIVLFARTLGVLLKSGVPILTSIEASERTMGNVCYKEALADVKEVVSRGESLSQAISRYKNLFSDTIILMVSVGEQTGNTGDMLERMGDIYEKDLETSMEHAVSLLGPILVLLLASIVFLLALAMYLPLFDMSKLVR